MSSPPLAKSNCELLLKYADAELEAALILCRERAHTHATIHMAALALEHALNAYLTLKGLSREKRLVAYSSDAALTDVLEEATRQGLVVPEEGRWYFEIVSEFSRFPHKCVNQGSAEARESLAKDAFGGGVTMSQMLQLYFRAIHDAIARDAGK